MTDGRRRRQPHAGRRGGRHLSSGRALLAFLPLLVLLSGAPSLAQDPSGALRRDADAAWGAGDHDRALTLYDRLLESSPDDRVALTRSGLVLSWAGRYDEGARRLRRAVGIEESRETRLALARTLAWAGRTDEAHAEFGRLLDADPDDREAALDDARALSWGRRYEEAARAFRALLERAPGDREAGLGFARTLAWSGRYAEAESEARTLLEADPGDAEARRLLADLYGWWGRTGSAEREYRRLAEDPSLRAEARAGIAKVTGWSGRDLWAGHLLAEALAEAPGDPRLITGEGYRLVSRGDLPAASRRADEAQPGDAVRARELRGEIERARGPWVSAAADAWSDTDDNDLVLLAASAGWRPALPVEVGVTLRNWRAESRATAGAGAKTVDRDRIEEASTREITAWAALWPGRTVSLRLHGGSLRHERFDGSERSHGVGGARLAFRPVPRLELGAGWAKEGVPWTAVLIDNDLTWERASLSFRWAPAARWQVRGEVSRAEIDDGNDDPGSIRGIRFCPEGESVCEGNRRDSAELEVTWFLRAERPRLRLGLVERRLDHRDDRTNGYFDPGDFLAHLLVAEVGGTAAGGRVRLSLRTEAGVQSFTLSGRDSGTDTVLGVQGVAGIRLGGRLWLRAVAGYTDYAAQTATGFSSRHLGVSLRWAR